MRFSLKQVALGMGAMVFAMAAATASPSVAQETVNPLQLAVESPLGDLFLGAADAPVTIVEYASMTCPHCRAFHEEVFDQLRSTYIDTGKVKFIMREFPLDPFAAAGFALARCMPGADGYYGMIDILFEQQPTWAGNYEGLVALATQAGFTQQTFDACLSNQDIIDGIYWSYDRGIELGVNATPTFYVNGEKVTGEISFADLSAIIDRLGGT